MGVARFERFQNVEIAGTQYLLVRQLSGHIWQLRDTQTGATKEYSQLELHQMLVEQKLRFPFSKEKLGIVHHIELSDREKCEIDRKMLYVKAVLELPNTRGVFESAIQTVWEKNKSITRLDKRPGWTTVYQWKSRYLTFGRDKRALLDRNWAKGNREPRFCRIVEEICLDSIENIYLTRERNNIADVLNHATAQVKALQAKLDKDLERNPESARTVLQMPSRRFIRSLLARWDEYDKYAARFSPQAARAKFRGVKGHIIADYPLHRVELDSTLLDLWVVDENGLALRRPWVTACIDVFTRCVLGIYVGFRPPSAESAIACLKDAFMPKPWLRQRYPDIHNELQYGVPKELIVDQAFENHSEQIEQSCTWLGVEIYFMARRHPWMKGTIERFMRSLNDGVAHGFPGTTFRSIAEKGDYDPKKEAVVRLSFLRWAIRKWQADVYHQRPHSALGGISPSQMWDQGIKPEDIPVPHDALEFEVNMGRPKRRKLTHQGILMDHLFYNSDALVSLRMREGADLWVDLRLDDQNLGHLWVLWGQNEAYEAKALRLDYAEGLSRYQHEQRRKYQKEHNLPKNPDGWLKATEELRCKYEEEGQRRRPQMPRGSVRDRDEGSNGWEKCHLSGVESSEAPVTVKTPPPIDVALDSGVTPQEDSRPETVITNYPVIIRSVPAHDQCTTDS